MDINTILWPTDLSEASLKAGVHVVSLAQKYDAEVILMYVAVDLCQMHPAYGNYPSVEHLNNFRDWEVEKARKRLEQICAEQLNACPFLKIRLVMGEPAAEILKMVDTVNADMLVITSRGHGLQDQTDPAFGHVAQKVVAAVTVPVHVVNP